MSNPFSLRTQPWQSFDEQSYSIFTYDFVHDKLFTIKANQKPSKGTISLRQSLIKKGDNYKTTGEIKILIPIWSARNAHIWFKIKTRGVKIHYDDGLKTINNSIFESYNLYANYHAHKNFKNAILKVGGALLAKNWWIDNRFRVEFPEIGEVDYSIGQRVSWNKNNWSFDGFNIYSFKQQGFFHNAIRIGYKKNDNDFFFRAENANIRSIKNIDFANLDTYFTNFTLDYVRKIDEKTRVGVETELTRRSHVKTSVVVQRSIPIHNTVLKAKVSNDKSVALSYQRSTNEYGKFTLGVEISDLGNTNKQKYGVQYQINL